MSGPIHLSEVPLSHFSATHREPRAVAAVPCSGLSGRVQSAPGGRSRLVATIVLLDATAETGGGRAGAIRVGMAVGSCAGRRLAGGRRDRLRVAHADLMGAPPVTRSWPPFGGRGSSRPPCHGCALAVPVIPAAALPLLPTAAPLVRIEGRARIHGGGAAAHGAEIRVCPADLLVGVGALRLHPVLGVADLLVGAEGAPRPPLPGARVAKLEVGRVVRVGDELLDLLLSREAPAKRRSDLG